MINEKKIIWLSSYPKSGNTWIRIALNLALEGKINLNEIKINSFSGLIKSYLEPTIKLKNPGEIINYWEGVQKSISNEISKGSYICLKTHNVLGKIGNEFFPTLKYTAGCIYIVRDPRDVAISYSNHFNITIDDSVKSMMNDDRMIYDPKKFYRSEVISSWKNHLISWRNSPFPILILRYEDLLKNPFQSFEKLFKFCNINPLIHINEIIKLSTFDNLSKLEKLSGFKESSVHGTPFFNEGKSEVWKNYPQKHFEIILDSCRELMREFNYI